MDETQATELSTEQTTSILAPDGRHDAANARRIAEEHHDRLRYVTDWQKFLVFEHGRWVLDRSETLAQRAAKSTAKRIWKLVKKQLSPDGDKAKQADLLKFGRYCSSRSGISNALHLSKSEPELVISHDELDTVPFLLNCKNGTLDLRTGQLRGHDPKDLITKLCPIEYDPSAPCPRWERFVSEVMEDKVELIEFLQRYAGYVLSGDVTEQILLICWGAGANGKSTFFETLLEMLGPDYATAGAEGLLTAKKRDSHPTEIADLFGRRLVVCAEIDAGREMSEARCKQLSGNDTLKARHCKEDFWSFVPTHKTVLYSNYLPKVKGVDHGIWRRLVLLPWQQKFWNPDKGESGEEKYKRDISLRDKLRQELPGILSWCVRGFQQWQAQGLCPPDSVRAATAQFKIDSDELKDFFADCCDLGDARFWVRLKFLYKEYQDWCSRSGFNPDTQKTFSQKLAERGLKKDRDSTGILFYGVKLKTPSASITAPPLPLPALSDAPQLDAAAG